MKYILLIAMLVLLSASNCSDPKEDIENDGLTYVIDKTTGLCFALYEKGSGNSHAVGLSYVPCEAILEKNKTEIK